ncbi:MFS transporter [Segniliparus rotundus]|uniref:MFS transporter n=1 Tax=Segniliparus rotundus TaxID=286802 RepID=UPI0006742251|nr:MFS transporter [Segniliparus rotundus]
MKFRWFFAARSASLFGSNAAPIALAFAVLEASHRSGDLGLVLAARSFALILLVLFGGVLSDRYPRDRVVLVGHLGAAATQAVAATILITGHFDLVAIMATEALNGALTALTGPGLYGMIGQVAPEGQVRKANALLGSTRQVATILGPSLGGLLVVTAGGGWALVLDAGCFLVAACCLAQLRLPKAGPEHPGGVFAELREGYGEFRTHTWIWTVVVGFAGLVFVQAGAWDVLGPVLAERSFGAQGWGLVLASEAMGFLVGNLVMYRLHIVKLMRLGQLCLVLTPLPLVPMALGAGLDWLLAASFFAGALFSVFGVAWDTSMQEHVPEEKLSRVASFDALGSWIAMPLGQVAALPLADFAGISCYLWAGAAVWCAMAVWPLFVPSLWHLEHGASKLGANSEGAHQPRGPMSAAEPADIGRSVGLTPLGPATSSAASPDRPPRR